MVVCETLEYRTFKEKEHLLQKLKKKFNNVAFSFLDDLNMIIYQYDDGIRDLKEF